MRLDQRLDTIPWEDYTPEIYFEGDMVTAGNVYQTYSFRIVVNMRSRIILGRDYPPIAAVVAHQVPIAHSAKAKVIATVSSTAPVAGWESILEGGAESDSVGKTEARVFPMRSIA
jgi:hypothetical protein